MGLDATSFTGALHDIRMRRRKHGSTRYTGLLVYSFEDGPLQTCLDIRFRTSNKSVANAIEAGLPLQITGLLAFGTPSSGSTTDGHDLHLAR